MDLRGIVVLGVIVLVASWFALEPRGPMSDQVMRSKTTYRQLGLLALVLFVLGYFIIGFGLFFACGGENPTSDWVGSNQDKACDSLDSPAWMYFVAGLLVLMVATWAVLRRWYLSKADSRVVGLAFSLQILLPLFAVLLINGPSNSA